MGAKGIIALLCCASLAFGGNINVTSNSQLNASLSNAFAGDTVFIHGGTVYTICIAPENSGTNGHPIVFRSYQSDVCSLYVSGQVLNISNLSYIYVKGLRLRTHNPTQSPTVVNLYNAHHNWIDRCRFYGGSNVDWDPMARLDSSNYNRFTRCFFDKGDVATDNSMRADGIELNHSSYYNILERDTMTNCSHFAFVFPRGVATSQAEVSMRHSLGNVCRLCVGYNNHVNFGTTDYGDQFLVEFFKGWSHGQTYTNHYGLSFEGGGRHCVVRRCEFYNDSLTAGLTEWVQGNSISSQSWGGRDYDNRYYRNLWWEKTSNSIRRDAFLITDDGTQHDTLGLHKFKGNIFISQRSPCWAVPFYWQMLVQPDSFDGNVLWRGVPNDTVVEHNTAGKKTLAQVSGTTLNLMTFGTNNKNLSPLFVDSLSVRGARSPEISAISPCKDAMIALTTVAGTVSNSTSVPVGDAGYFHPNWGSNPYDRGDSLVFDVNGTPVYAELLSISGNTLTLTANKTIAAGSRVDVWASFNSVDSTWTHWIGGSLPDIGPYEIGAGTEPPPPPGSIPDTTTLVSPANGGTYTQPIMFKWRAVSGATKYWFNNTADHWATTFYSNSALTDTFVTVSGMPHNTLILWGVAAGNPLGWSAFTGDWQLTTASAPATGQTVTVDWNKVITSSVLTDNAQVVMTNMRGLASTVVLHNPSRKAVTWPAGVVWVGLSGAPAFSDTVGVFEFVRDGSTLYGFIKRNDWNGK